jgi:hypothetical protein
MMMGFWHTGYFEHHEPSGFETTFQPHPTIYNCPHCGYTTKVVEELRRHRFEAHPYNRPLLFIRDAELGNAPFRVSKRLLPADIKSDRCARATINGKPVPIIELGSILSKINRDTVTIELEGDRVSAVFKICFEIAEENDLAAVEKNFYEVARGRRLDRRAIEHFIHSSKPYGTAIGYCDGICDYFYGVLAKERSLESALPYQAYREKFNRAADRLKDFDRPLANILGALIAFHFNHFNEARTLAATSRVGIAASRFCNWLSQSIDEVEYQIDIKHSNFENLVTDIDTERFIRWSVLESKELLLHKDEIVFWLKKEISDFDKAKGCILLSELALELGDSALATHYAREFRNSPTMGAWAEHIIAASKKIG